MGKGNFKHGDRDSRLYRVWTDMKQRCLNPNNRDYPEYGGRGIEVCEQWLEYIVFKRDMAEPHRPGMQLDRIDNAGNYTPDNCRWSTPKENSRNTRKNILYTFGDKTCCLAEWSEITGIKYATLYGRLRKGWPLEQVFTRKPS